MPENGLAHDLNRGSGPGGRGSRMSIERPVGGSLDSTLNVLRHQIAFRQYRQPHDHLPADGRRSDNLRSHRL